MAKIVLPEPLPKVLRPKLRLFLSADVVGSTALKQSDIAGELAVEWLSVFEKFYSEMANELARAWGDRRLELSEIDPSGGDAVDFLGDEPVFWKTVGDEIIFYKELTDSRQIHATLECWVAALRKIRQQLATDKLRLRAEGTLDVKSAVWIAGFPRRNKEVTVLIQPGTRVDDYYIGKANVAEPASDFIGPGIDTGFRVASLASPQKMILSLDAAYIIAVASPHPKFLNERLALHFDGRFPLKGVFNNKERYPIFWIDTVTGDELDLLETNLRGLQGIVDVRTLAQICQVFYSKYSNFLHMPFIWNDKTEALIHAPDWYQDWLNDAAKNYYSRTDIRDKADEVVGGALPDISPSGNDPAVRQSAIKNAARIVTEKINQTVQENE